MVGLGLPEVLCEVLQLGITVQGFTVTLLVRHYLGKTLLQGLLDLVQQENQAEPHLSYLAIYILLPVESKHFFGTSYYMPCVAE